MVVEKKRRFRCHLLAWCVIVDRINSIKDKTLCLYFGGDRGGLMSPPLLLHEWGRVRDDDECPHGDSTSLLPGQHEKVWSSVKVREAEV